jgi:hypothetical protein
MRNLTSLTILAAGALLAGAAPAAAQNEAPSGTRAASENASQRQIQDQNSQADNRQVCVTERLSGSRMPRRVCRTAREWALLQGGDDDR